MVRALDFSSTDGTYYMRQVAKRSVVACALYEEFPCCPSPSRTAMTDADDWRRQATARNERPGPAARELVSHSS